MLSKGKYSVAIYVGNTAVYAYCDEENEGKVASILREIGYFEPSSNNEEDKTTVEDEEKSTDTLNSETETETESDFPVKLIRVFYFLAFLVLARGTLMGFWMSVCEAANINIFEVKEYKKSHHIKLNLNKDLYYWMLNSSSSSTKFKFLYFSYHLCFLPSIIFAFLSIIGLFTSALDKIINVGEFLVMGMLFAEVFFNIFYSVFNKNKRSRL